jgi:hypothetical protein
MKEYTVDEFIEELHKEIEINEDQFILNMMDGSAPSKMSFMGWLHWFLTWMEWGDEESYEMAYED